MRSRSLLTLPPALLLALTALPAAPAAAHSHTAAYDTARAVLRAADPVVAAVCDAVDSARTVLDRAGVVVDQTGVGTCPRDATALVDRLEELDPVGPSSDTRYIVVLKSATVRPTTEVPEPSAKGVTAFAAEQASTLTSTPDGAAFAAWQAGARVDHVYRHALRGYSARMTTATLAAVQADPNVDYVEQDQDYEYSVRQPNPPWGLDRIDERTLPMDTNYYYNQTGAGIRAYVIDSGINFAHTEFGGRAIFGADTSNTPSGNAVDCIGHGTHVAGTLGGTTYGVAKGITLVAVRVGDCSTLTSAGIIAGIDWATADHLPGQRAVANLSLGGPPSTAIDTSVQSSINDGIVYSIAAGNSNANACNTSPARVAAAMTIAASTSTDQRAGWSNWGTCVDWFAPGDGITSAWIGSATATNTIGGTSMASPHNAGVAALYLEAYPTATVSQVVQGISDWTTKNIIGSAGTGTPPHLLHVATPLHIGAGGTITITRTTGPATWSTTGVFATSEYSCSMPGPLVEVICTANYNPDIVWECIHFLLTAQAPAPGNTGTGDVAGRVTCDSGQTLKTDDVFGTGTKAGDNWVTGEQMGTAYVVRCRAAGVNSAANPTGSYQVTCDEPSVRYPYGD